MTQFKYSVRLWLSAMNEKSGKRRWNLSRWVNRTKWIYVVIVAHMHATVKHDVFPTHTNQNAASTNILTSTWNEHLQIIIVVHKPKGITRIDPMGWKQKNGLNLAIIRNQLGNLYHSILFKRTRPKKCGLHEDSTWFLCKTKWPYISIYMHMYMYTTCASGPPHPEIQGRDYRFFQWSETVRLRGVQILPYA